MTDRAPHRIVGALFTGFLGVGSLLCASATAKDQTFVVAMQHGPGVDFLSIQAAVNAASDGDIVLVQAGTYSGFFVTEKGVTVQGEPGALVVVQSRGQNAIEIANTYEEHTSVLRNLTVRAENAHAVVAAGSAGVVWIEDCFLDSHTKPTQLPLAYPALRSHESKRVILVRDNIQGAAAVAGTSGTNHPASAGLIAYDSQVFMYESIVRGGKAALIGTDVVPGAAAVELEAGLLFAARNTFIGGDGVLLPPPVGQPCSIAVGNGAGLWLKASEPEAHLLETTAIAGGGSLGGCGGLPTNPTKVESGTLSVIPGFTRLIGAPSVVHAQSRVSIVYTGKPGDFAFIAHSTATVAAFNATAKGCMFLDQPFTLIPLGVIPSGGILPIDIQVPALPPGSDAHRLFFQAAFFDGSGSGIPYLTNPEPVTILK